MAPLQVQARALGDPTRYAVFRYLADAGVPIGVAELTDHVGLHHNAVRQHLAKLTEAGLVVEATARPVGRGRPRLVYQVDPAAEGRWGGEAPYERLAVLLAEVTRTGDAPVDVGRRAGRRMAQEAPPGAEPVDALATVMARQGFDPRVRARGEARDVVLRSCPFASAVLADPDTVCDLHLGLARGIAEAVGGLAVDVLVAKDPRRAQCRLECRTVPT